MFFSHYKKVCAIKSNLWKGGERERKKLPERVERKIKYCKFFFDEEQTTTINGIIVWFPFFISLIILSFHTHLIKIVINRR